MSYYSLRGYFAWIHRRRIGVLAKLTAFGIALLPAVLVNLMLLWFYSYFSRNDSSRVLLKRLVKSDACPAIVIRALPRLRHLTDRESAIPEGAQ